MQWYQLADAAAGWKGKLIPSTAIKALDLGSTRRGSCADIPGSGTHKRWGVDAASQTSWWGECSWSLGVTTSSLREEEVLGMQDVFPGTSNTFHSSRGQLRFGDIGGEWIVVPPIDTHGCFPNICFPLGCGLSYRSISISKYIHLNTFLLTFISKSFGRVGARVLPWGSAAIPVTLVHLWQGQVPVALFSCLIMVHL